MNSASEHARSAGGSAVDSDVERWEVDATRSRLTFNLRHIVVRRIRGEFLSFGGTVFIDRRHPSLSRVELWIDLASLTTGEPERDAHVCSPEFLNVAQFPRARFKSTGAEVRGIEVVLDGRLELHDIVRDVEVRANIGPATKAGPEGPARQRFTIRAALDRQSFGLHWNQDLDVGGVVVGDEVAIVGEIELVRSAPAV